MFHYTYAEDFILKTPKNPVEYEMKEAQQIHIYIFDVTYINGKTIRKVSSITPDEYLYEYRNYIKCIDKKEMMLYTVSEFKRKFGKNSFSQLQQGVFGRNEYDMVVMNRKKRGMEGM
jgi:hypothetical protein